MAKHTKKPEFYKLLMTPSFYEDANKSIKYQDSNNYWIFKTGGQVYKVKKPTSGNSAINLDQVFVQEIEREVQMHSPGMKAKMFFLNQVEGDQSEAEFQLAERPEGKDSYFVLQETQLADRGFVSSRLAKGSLKAEHMVAIAEFLSGFHKEAKVSDAKNIGNSEDLKGKVDAYLYQAKKYLGGALTQPMIDMMLHPVVKFLESNKKLLGQRSKKGFVRWSQGCFVPEKIYVQGKEVLCLGRREDPIKNRYRDVAADLSDLSLALIFAGKKELSDTLVAEYSKRAEDENLTVILPLYQMIRALSLGLEQSMLHHETGIEEHQVLAKDYYELMVELARSL